MSNPLSASTKYKKRFAIASFFAMVFLGLFLWSFITSKNDPEKGRSRKIIQQLKSENKFLSKLIDADQVLILKSDYEEALKKYEALKPTDFEDYEATLDKRIEFAKKMIAASQKSDDGSVNYQIIIEQNKSAIAALEEELEAAQSAQPLIDSLKDVLENMTDELKKKNKQLERKDLVQVISFKNENGKTIHYLGEVSNGKANGGGVGIWNTGSIYRGDWKNNQRHGKGTFEWADGEKYVGEYRNDKRHGEGAYYWPSGERYQGEWDNDRRTGYGTLYDQDGNIRYEGSWKDDKPNKN